MFKFDDHAVLKPCLSLSGTVKRESRHPATQKAIFHCSCFFLGRFEPGNDHYHRRPLDSLRHAEIGRHLEIFERYLMAFRRRIEIGRSLGIACDALLRGWNILVEILRRVVASKVIRHRCQKIRLGGAFSVAFCLVLAGEDFVSRGGCAPLPAPVIPRADARASRDEVVVVDSLHDHAWRPGCQDMSDGGIGMLNKHGKPPCFSASYPKSHGENKREWTPNVSKMSPTGVGVMKVGGECVPRYRMLAESMTLRKRQT